MLRISARRTYAQSAVQLGVSSIAASFSGTAQPVLSAS